MKEYEKVVIVIRDTADDVITLSPTGGGDDNELPEAPILSTSIFTANG